MAERPIPPLTEVQRALVEKNVWLAWYVARKLFRRIDAVRRLGIEDVRQIATVGLIRAAVSFDPARGIKFSTYAAKAAKREIWRQVANQSYMVSLPDYFFRPTTGHRHIDQAQAAMRNRGSTTRMESEIAARDSKASRDEHDTPPLAQLLKLLPQRSRRILFWRFWLDLTLEDCGRRLGVTKARVQQIEVESLIWLREIVVMQRVKEDG